MSTGGGVSALTGVTNSYRPPFDLGVHGPLARSAEDLKLAMNVIVSVPKHQKSAIHIDLPKHRQTDLSNFRVGGWFSDSTFPPDAESEKVFDELRNRLEQSGVNILSDKPDVDLKASHDLRNLFEATGLSHMRSPEEAKQVEQFKESDDEEERS